MSQSNTLEVHRKLVKNVQEIGSLINTWNETNSLGKQQASSLLNFLPRFEEIVTLSDMAYDNASSREPPSTNPLETARHIEYAMGAEFSQTVSFIQPNQTSIEAIGVLAFIPGHVSKLKGSFIS